MICEETRTDLGGISFLWLEVTAKCNLECLHCYADSGPRLPLLGKMRAEDWLSVIRESSDLGCRQIQFIGGEPTLHPDLAQMIEFASGCGYGFIEVFTNAVALSEHLLGRFVRFGVRVATSFYSDDPAIHDLITGHPGSFERSLGVLKRIVAAGLRVRAGIIETSANVGHAERAWLFLDRIGISDVNIDVQRAVGRGGRGSDRSGGMSDLCGECWKGKLCVTSSGKVYPCVFSRFAEVGTLENGLRRILAGRELLTFRDSLRTSRAVPPVSGAPEVQPVYGQTGPCNPRCSPCGPRDFNKCMPVEATGPCGPDALCVPTSICSPNVVCGPTLQR